MSAPMDAVRRDGLAEFFECRHRKLVRRVGYFARNAPGTTVEDACAFAWAQLTRRTDIGLDDSGYWWLATVAVHEAWRLMRATREELPSGLFWPETDIVGELPNVLRVEYCSSRGSLALPIRWFTTRPRPKRWSIRITAEIALAARSVASIDTGGSVQISQAPHGSAFSSPK